MSFGGGPFASTAFASTPPESLPSEVGFFGGTVHFVNGGFQATTGTGATGEMESGGVWFVNGGFVQTAGPPPSPPFPSDARITVSLVNAEDPSWVEVIPLADSFAWTWQETFNDTGTGSIQLVNTDTTLAAIDYDSALQFHLDGIPAFTMLVEGIETETISPNEEADQVTTIAGRGAVAMLDDIAVYPEGGADHLPVGDDRVFFFGMQSFNDSGWATANVQAVYSDTTPNWNDIEANKAPRQFPDPLAGYLWNGLGDVNNAPEGTVYFRGAFTLVRPMKVRVYASGDNLWTLWLDGTEIMGEGEDGTTWLDTQQSEVFDMSAGDHILAARVTNTAPYVDEFSVVWPNPAFLIVTVMMVNPTNGEETPVFRTDGSWKVTNYLTVAPPITAGEILNIILDEGSARGCVVPSVTFTDTNDSDGFGWSTHSTAGGPIFEFTTSIGESVLSVLRALSDTYVDFRMRYGSNVLDVWDKSGHLLDSGTVFVSGYADPVNGNLTQLRHVGGGGTPGVPTVAGPPAVEPAAVVPGRQGTTKHHKESAGLAGRLSRRPVQ